MKREMETLTVWNLTVMTTLMAGLMMGALLSGCSSFRSILAVNSNERLMPIANPFGDFQANAKNQPPKNIVLRTKKGDRSVELEIPGSADQMSDFVLPVSPAFRDGHRGLASVGREEGSSEGSGAESGSLDESLRNHASTVSDHEIAKSFPQTQPEDEGRRQTIEQGLHLTPNEDDSLFDDKPSYLARLDHIKQLYKTGRFEAGLVETDEMVKQYPTSPKLHEMRGTLLHQLGRNELALKSWNQALRFDPKNEPLRRFIERKQRAPVGTP